LLKLLTTLGRVLLMDDSHPPSPKILENHFLKILLNENFEDQWMCRSKLLHEYNSVQNRKVFFKDFLDIKMEMFGPDGKKIKKQGKRKSGHHISGIFSVLFGMLNKSIRIL